MKNTSYIGISLVILIFGIIFIPKILDRLNNHNVVENDRLNIGVDKKRVKKNERDLPYIIQYGKKKKVEDFKFVNQNDDTITNQDYAGKVYVVEFFFSTCPSICPIMSANLVEVEKEFKNNNEFGIASFSIDPEHDTPEVLKKYAEHYGINDPDWNLMTGKREEIYELANKQFGIFASEDETVAGGFAHSGLFALVDKEGYIRSRNDEFGNPIIYYRGFIEKESSITEGEETQQIDILIEDIKRLL